MSRSKGHVRESKEDDLVGESGKESCGGPEQEVECGVVG